MTFTKKKRIVIVSLAIFLVFVLVISSVFFVSKVIYPFCDRFFGEQKIPEPTVTTGEFPIQLEASVNGEHIFVEDAVICEYLGYEQISPWARFSILPKREWNQYFQKNNEETYELYRSDNLRVELCSGDGEYYMSDTDEYYSWGNPLPPYIYVVTFDSNGQQETFAKLWLSPEKIKETKVALKEYNIDIIKFYSAPPIENTFEYKD